MRLRITALWVIPLALVAAGFAAAWAAAVGAAERYNNMTISSVAEFDWASLASAIAEPLLLTGFVAVLVALAVHALLWRPRPD
jgi:hypothetical protein